MTLHLYFSYLFTVKASSRSDDGKFEVTRGRIGFVFVAAEIRGVSPKSYDNQKTD